VFLALTVLFVLVACMVPLMRRPSFAGGGGGGH
jgi:MFS transporter, DHA2 family, multidrug resistance protein